jgi:hypothetical protein
MAELKISYGLDETDKLVYIVDALKGTNYFCPECKTPLILRAGEVKIKHFAHQSLGNCTNESVLHKVYKMVLANNKRIRLPYLVDGRYNLDFDRVELEKQLFDFRPDATGYIGDDMYIIEFEVTHAVDKRKLEKIKKANIPAIEIYCCDQSIERIESDLASSTYYRNILHWPGFDDGKTKLIEENIELKERLERAAYYFRQERKETIRLARELNELRESPFPKACWFNFIKEKNGVSYFKNKESDVWAWLVKNGSIVVNPDYRSDLAKKAERDALEYGGANEN